MMNYYGYGWGMMRPGFGIGGLIGTIFWILLGLLFIMLIIKLVVHGSNKYSEEEEHKPGEETPMIILKKRYAKGEISFKDFEKMKKDIS